MAFLYWSPRDIRDIRDLDVLPEPGKKEEGDSHTHTHTHIYIYYIYIYIYIYNENKHHPKYQQNLRMKTYLEIPTPVGT